MNHPVKLHLKGPLAVAGRLVRALALPLAAHTRSVPVVVLLSLLLANASSAQTSIVCDTDGDTAFSSGKGGPAVPPWLDISQSAITSDSAGNIFFTLTMNAPIPEVPAWRGVDDGGQLWWGWRMIGDVSKLTFVSNGCLHGKGTDEAAVYFLDLIWNVQTASFRARLLDDTSCTENPVAFAFSADRRQITLLLPKTLLTNRTLIPDPDSFQYLTQIVVWKAGSTGNWSATLVDAAPNQIGLVLGSWSSSSNTVYSCP